jgi:hypothetical protein
MKKRMLMARNKISNKDAPLFYFKHQSITLANKQFAFNKARLTTLTPSSREPVRARGDP